MHQGIDRRSFVKGTLLASAGALGLQAGAQIPAGEAPPAPGTVKLPKARIGKMEVSRLLLGGNLLTHYTHSRDLRYVYNLTAHYNTKEKIFETMALAEAQGIDTLSIHNPPGIIEMLKEYREKRGGKIRWIVCPIAPMEEGLAAYKAMVGQLLDLGTDSLYVWGVHSDALVAQGKVHLIAQAVELFKSKGVPAGVGGHNLEVIKACEKEGVNADFYLKTLHHHNYPSATPNHDSSWCSNPEETVEFMKGVKRPWIAYKAMAAGAIPPGDAFPWAFANGADFVLAGMFDFEVAEDVRIAREAFTAAKAKPRPRPWGA
jgi:hypothetical protein